MDLSTLYVSRAMQLKIHHLNYLIPLCYNEYKNEYSLRIYLAKRVSEKQKLRQINEFSTSNDYLENNQSTLNGYIKFSNERHF